MTNTVVYESGVQVNSDGLRVKYGLAEARKGVAGTVASKDDERYLYVDLDWSRLPAFAASTHGQLYGSEPESSIPTGAYIESAVLTVENAFTSGGSATLSIGLADNTGQNGSHAGFWSTEAVASMTADTVLTSSGALLNTITTTPLYLWVEVGTANFTAGNGRLKITYFMPRSV